MKKRRAEWNKGHRELRRMIGKGNVNGEWKKLFLSQHAWLNSDRVVDKTGFSYQDYVLDDVSEKEFRSVPRNGEQSLVWIIWHIARVEDITMNILLAKRDQVFIDGGWQARVGSSIVHSGNEVSPEEIKALSREVSIQPLLDYRDAVSMQTRENVASLDESRLSKAVAPEGIERIWQEKALRRAAKEVADYWSSRTLAGLLLMPPTRHIMIHLNNALKIKEALRVQTQK